MERATPSMTLARALELARRPAGMSAAEATELLEALLAGAFAAVDAAMVLVAMAERGETSTELAAFVRGLLARAVTPVVAPSIDVCGTGGSGLARYNVSTTVAFILAAAGIPVAKHGNKGSRRPNGSFDLLDGLGIPYALSAESLARLHRDTGICFLFARALHPAVAAVAPARKAAGRRTIFNLAGPLANPCRPTVQLIGTIDARTSAVVASALVDLRCPRACVAWGEPGIDELSIIGTSHLCFSGDLAGAIDLAPTHPGLRYEAIPGGDAPENTGLFEGLLNGSERGPLRDLVLLNAGAAIDLWQGRIPAPGSVGMQLADRLLAEGRVAAIVDRHRRLAVDLARREGATS
jgi:anthranilate phosphoribosyltransferase